MERQRHEGTEDIKRFRQPSEYNSARKAMEIESEGATGWGQLADYDDAGTEGMEERLADFFQKRYGFEEDKKER